MGLRYGCNTKSAVMNACMTYVVCVYLLIKHLLRRVQAAGEHWEQAHAVTTRRQFPLMCVQLLIMQRTVSHTYAPNTYCCTLIGVWSCRRQFPLMCVQLFMMQRTVSHT